MGARSGATDQEQQCETADQLVHERLLLATSLPKAGIVTLQIVDCGYSNAKTRLQSFFMLITVQPFFFASS